MAFLLSMLGLCIEIHERIFALSTIAGVLTVRSTGKHISSNNVIRV